MRIIVFGSSRVGGVKIATTSLAKSLNFIGYKTEYVYGYKALKFLFSYFVLPKNKYYFVTWGIYNLLPLPRSNVISIFHGFPSINQQDYLRYNLFRFIIFVNKLRNIKTVSVSKYSQSILKDIYKFDSLTIRNSIPFDYLNNKYQIDLVKDIDIIFVGRANKFKLPFFILVILEYLANNGKKIFIIGEGKSKDNYLKLNKNSLINFYDFIPHNELIKLLQRSKYFISCSDSEPFGIVFLEALLYGCNLISPRSGGLLEIASIFPSSYRDRFKFYDNEKDAKNLLKGLDFNNNNNISSNKLNRIYKIIKKEFNPEKHARDIISNFENQD